MVSQRSELQQSEIQRNDAVAIAERNVLQQPERRRALHAHAEHFDIRERDARRLAALGQARRIENVETARPAETNATVAQAVICAERKLLALQSVLAVVGLDRAR